MKLTTFDNTYFNIFKCNRRYLMKLMILCFQYARSKRKKYAYELYNAVRSTMFTKTENVYVILLTK